MSWDKLDSGRIADGHYDFPKPSNEWRETDLKAQTAVRIKGTAFEDGCDLNNARADQATASLRNSLAPQFDPLASLRTKGQRQRFCRNLAIAVGHRFGNLSQRQLAAIFELPHSRIGEIIKEMEALACSS